METPLFYCPNPELGFLPDAEAYHVQKVLRAKPGVAIQLTDGKGACIDAVLTEVTVKKVGFRIENRAFVNPRPHRIEVAVAPTRKAERNEWMLEKLVEIGIESIHFMKTAHTHTESFHRVVNPERMERIAVSAMKQSGQFYLPAVKIGTEFTEILRSSPDRSCFIAYVPDKFTAPHLANAAWEARNNTLVLIGPEGDFTPSEVEEAVKAGFGLVSLGATRLRTETAAIAACHSLHLAHAFRSRPE